jgi:hypothetical protein
MPAPAARTFAGAAPLTPPARTYCPIPKVLDLRRKRPVELRALRQRMLCAGRHAPSFPAAAAWRVYAGWSTDASSLGGHKDMIPRRLHVPADTAHLPIPDGCERLLVR